jgi:predicted PurR-regulated permease PerM
VSSKTLVAIVVVFILVGIAAGYGASFLYQPQVQTLQNLQNTRNSIKLVRWQDPCVSFLTSCTNEVRATNNNNFDITLKQVVESVVDSSGNQITSGTYTTPVVVRAGNSVTIPITVTLLQNAAGVSVEATFDTPAGQVVVGSI